MDERRVTVEPASAPAYEVRVGHGLAPAFAAECASVLGHAPGRLFAAIDDGVPDAFVRPVLDAFRDAGYAVTTHAVHATERTKSLETLGELLGAIASAGLERRDPVLAIGGGIVGDVAGYAAASYRRGVPVIQCPTTLLSMVDASVGGKTGVNLTVPTESGEPALLKNMAGAFHQPRAVLADVSALGSLSERQFRAGLAECVKHGLISGDWDDPALGAWIDANVRSILERDGATLVECVSRNVAVKARVVAADEKEKSDTGGRALLNLGHTFAHAIETIPTLTPDGDPAHAPLHHGEAVALGLVGASACAAAMGLVDTSHTERTIASVSACGLPVRVGGLPDDETLIARMRHDKKAAGGVLRLTLPTGAASAALVADPPLEAVRTGWAAIRAD
jgi:3-dehydroquinate synthetase